MIYLAIYLFLSAFLLTYSLIDWSSPSVISRVMSAMFIALATPLLFVYSCLVVLYKRLFGRVTSTNPLAVRL